MITEDTTINFVVAAGHSYTLVTTGDFGGGTITLNNVLNGVTSPILDASQTEPGSLRVVAGTSEMQLVLSGSTDPNIDWGVTRNQVQDPTSAADIGAATQSDIEAAIAEFFDVESRIVKDLAASPSSNFEARALIDSSGTDALNWESRFLNDVSNAVSLNWTDRILYDGFNAQSLNWVNRALVGSSGSATLDWENRYIYDASSLLSLDWNSRGLYDDSGNLSLGWAGRVLYDPAGEWSIDWQTRGLISDYGYATVDWQSCSLNEPIDNFATLNWALGQLQWSNILVASWGATGITSETALRTVPVTVASLGSASTFAEGARRFVTDANATTFNSIVAGGGSNKVPVFSDGTNWRIG